MEKKIKHLEMIQLVIARMATNCFALKSQTVIFVLAIFAFIGKSDAHLMIAIAYLPTLSFWLLDGFFLKEERGFRSLYDHVRTLNEDEIDFSMDRTPVMAENMWRKAMLSKTLVIFYLTILMVITVLFIFANIL